MENVGGWFMGPSAARIGETVSLSVNGIERAVQAVFSASNASLSSNRVPVTNGAAHVSAQMTAAGKAVFSMQAFDSQGAVAHEATHAIQVSGGDARGEPPTETRVQLFSSPAIAGQGWTLTLRGIERATSVLVELFGANGGICRIFPRGRNEMSLGLTPKQPGTMIVAVSCRDQTLSTFEVASGKIDVKPAGEPADVSAAPPRPLCAAPLPDTALGLQKPPYVLPHDTFAGEPDGLARPALSGGTASMHLSSAPSLEEISRDMQARTDAMLDRLKKR